jgi:hypothetical protein
MIDPRRSQTAALMVMIPGIQSTAGVGSEWCPSPLLHTAQWQGHMLAVGVVPSSSWVHAAMHPLSQACTTCISMCCMERY